MTQKAVVAGLLSTNIHYNLLVLSESVKSIPTGRKTGAEFTTSPSWEGTLAVDVAEQRSCPGVMEASAEVLALRSPRLWEWASPGPNF